MKNNHLVIMAGGVGSRFWPLSSEERPKQFLDVLGCGKTLLQLTADRFSGVVPVENVWVVTSAAYHDLVREQLPDLPEGNILLEPCRRNTAPCIAYVSWRIKKINPRANIVVTPSDHVVADIDAFKTAITEAMEFSAETDAIVTLGIRPDRPETGYGYIEGDLSYSSSRKKNIFRVDSFKEKPALEVAQEYIKQNNYFWNSGIFVWSVNTIVNAFRVYCPEMARIFEELMPVFGTDGEQEAINREFPNCENISVDYAIMEKAEEIFVYPASFGWSDLGSWSSLRKQVKQDLHGNACIGENIDLYETNNCIVHTTQEKKVVVQGLDGYVVVEKDDILLICKLSEEQRIRLFH
ncbi:mannose-1-phosphate guanylyltransferase (GDP) [Prevotella sp. CAG:755]|nr:mannose-1-phosphate guanylyltransferase (GDP) [Prevotella sp. CAG:755]